MPTLIESLDVHTFPVPFKVVFRHASASRAEAQNIIVAARAPDGTTGYGEGCPREYVTGETVESAVAFVRQHSASISAAVRNIAELREWMRAHSEAIDANPAAFCAIEIAVLDLLGKVQGCPIEDLLEVPRLSGTFRYSAVLGDSELPSFERQAAQYLEMGFRDFKVKVSGDADRDRRKLAMLTRTDGPAPRIRLDANNLWFDAGQAIRYLKALDADVFAIEEPLMPGDFTGCSDVAAECGVQIILDESLTRIEQLRALNDPVPWIINLRVSKMGGILRSLALAQESSRRSIGLIVGAQVGETSILTRAALTIMNPHRESLLASEGAFGTLLLTRDLTHPTPPVHPRRQPPPRIRPKPRCFRPRPHRLEGVADIHLTRPGPINYLGVTPDCSLRGGRRQRNPSKRAKSRSRVIHSQPCSIDKAAKYASGIRLPQTSASR